jgi:hypothetical protein
MEVRHISQYIARTPDAVVRFAGDPQNLPAWASGLATGVERRGDLWVAASPMGEITIRFAPANDLGVLDHDVTTPDGTVFHNPMRVVPHGSGSEIVFTLFRSAGMSDADFEADTRTIAGDLAAMRVILEADAGE